MEKVFKELKKFNEERDWGQFHTESNLAKSISIESAELLECFQWNDNDFNLEEVKDELADILNYCMLMCIKIDVKPEELILNKLEETKKKYPIEKSKGVSTKYTKL